MQDSAIQSEFISTLLEVFKTNANPEQAQKMEAYMKNRFKMFGINAPLRESLSQPFLEKTYLPDRETGLQIIKQLWMMPERELHYFALHLAEKYNKTWKKEDIEFLEFLIVNQSWWDTVDFVAPKLVGKYFKLYPEQIVKITEKWLQSENIWLQRSCLLFQLKYKKDLNTHLLSHFITNLNGGKEFFINKAIGWVLREYSKTDKEWVRDFISNNPLSGLSLREASKYL